MMPSIMCILICNTSKIMKYSAKWIVHWMHLTKISCTIIRVHSNTVQLYVCYIITYYKRLKFQNTVGAYLPDLVISISVPILPNLSQSSRSCRDTWTGSEVSSASGLFMLLLRPCWVRKMGSVQSIIDNRIISDLHSPHYFICTTLSLKNDTCLLLENPPFSQFEGSPSFDNSQ